MASCQPCRPRRSRRPRRGGSRRLLAALEPSATLAVDAKAKALRAAGEPVISFGAGEPDFPTPADVVEAAAAACHDPAMHKYSPTAGLPALARGDLRKDRPRQRAGRRAGPGARHQRRQARRVHRARDAARPRRRGPDPLALLDDLPRGRRGSSGACRSRSRRRRRPGSWSRPTTSRPAAGRAPVRSSSTRRATRRAPCTRRHASESSGSGPRRTTCGSSATRSTSTWSSATPCSPPCPSSCPSSWTAPSSSTASRRPTR